ncbi:MAG: HD domain-containing protein [Candidatus Riflebacteria bacterium]|nr:HD domain-containing protein [Candidatus Riflebacteria bacterium]
MIINFPQLESNLLREILSFLHPSATNQVWLVGGSIRDIIKGKKSKIYDLDLVTSFNPIEKCKKFANQTKSGFVILDDERNIVRIVYETKNKEYYTFDVSQFKADTIDNDLLCRDFTINAIAAPLFDEGEKLLENNKLSLYDPLEGITDLKNNHIKVCSSESFKSDPLRIMRAFRFSSIYEAEITNEIKHLFTLSQNLLVNVSGERIRDELFKVFATKNSVKYIKEMADLKILDIIFPELEKCRNISQNDWHHLDVFDHTILTYENFEKLLNLAPPHFWWNKFINYLHDEISPGRTYLQSLKFGCLLHDLGKIPCRMVDKETGKIIFHGHEMQGAKISKEIAARLKLSSVESIFQQKLVKNHMRPGVILQQGISNKRLFRYYTECGIDGTGIALLSLADRLAALGNYNEDDIVSFTAGIYQIMSEYFIQQSKPVTKELLRGDDLILLGAKPGPLFRTILEAVKEAQYTGEIKTKEEAIQMAENFIEQMSQRK